MDADEVEMLSEARARLAATKAAKAQRKAREHHLAASPQNGSSRDPRYAPRDADPAATPAKESHAIVPVSPAASPRTTEQIEPVRLRRFCTSACRVCAPVSPASSIRCLRAPNLMKVMGAATKATVSPSTRPQMFR